MWRSTFPLDGYMCSSQLPGQASNIGGLNYLNEHAKQKMVRARNNNNAICDGRRVKLPLLSNASGLA